MRLFRIKNVELVISEPLDEVYEEEKASDLSYSPMPTLKEASIGLSRALDVLEERGCYSNILKAVYKAQVFLDEKQQHV